MKMLRLEKFFVNNLQSKKRTLVLARKLLSYVELNGKKDFLEVGCGNGLVSKYIAKNYSSSVIGIDVDPEQIELARKDAVGISNIRFLAADATNLPFEDNSFDIVLSFGVLHHIYKWLDALKEIGRVLRVKGYFVYADLIYPGWVTRMDRSSKISFGLVTINIEDLNLFIKQNGFTTVHNDLTKRLIFQNYKAVYSRY